LQVQGHPLLLASLVGATSLHPQLTEALHDAAVNACKQRRFKHLGGHEKYHQHGDSSNPFSMDNNSIKSFSNP
jgi:uncharacterized protein YcgI (DUF1989 family)